MRLAEFAFPPGHPVYFKPPDMTRWPDALPGLKPRAFTPPQPPGAPTPAEIREPLGMFVTGHPSVSVYQNAQGNLVERIQLRSQYAQGIDLGEITALSRRFFEAIKRLSLGPYDHKALRRMGYPYGYGERGSVPSMARLANPRRIPSFTIRQRRGARAAVPNRSVINTDGGLLARSWGFTVNATPTGADIFFYNTAKSRGGASYPWFLAHGTYKMQPHGPLPAVTEEMLPAIQVAWRQGAQAAASQQRGLEQQYGAGAVVAQQAKADAGGFA